MNGVIKKAVDFAVNIANDETHGYDQKNRNGKPDFDCSSLVITSWENAGVKVKENGATFTGNMKAAFLKCNFQEVIDKANVKTGTGLIAGDILLHEGKHTAMHIGNGQLVHASINENGQIVGGKPGDQTGKEIAVRKYYNHPWNSVLRYTEEITVEEAKTIVKEKTGFSDSTIAYLANDYRYGTELILKLANILKEVNTNGH